MRQRICRRGPQGSACKGSAAAPGRRPWSGEERSRRGGGGVGAEGGRPLVSHSLTHSLTHSLAHSLTHTRKGPAPRRRVPERGVGPRAGGKKTIEQAESLGGVSARERGVRSRETLRPGMACGGGCAADMKGGKNAPCAVACPFGRPPEGADSGIRRRTGVHFSHAYRVTRLQHHQSRGVPGEPHGGGRDCDRRRVEGGFQST